VQTVSERKEFARIVPANIKSFRIGKDSRMASTRSLPTWPRSKAVATSSQLSRSRPMVAYGIARMGVLQAINRHQVREFDTARKPHHWGKRKLKRDE
jgi:hypothetical protein